jgi:hypothetical protein
MSDEQELIDEEVDYGKYLQSVLEYDTYYFDKYGLIPERDIQEREAYLKLVKESYKRDWSKTPIEQDDSLPF